MPTDMNELNTESRMPSYGVWDDEPCLIGLLNVHRTSTGLFIGEQYVNSDGAISYTIPNDLC